VAACRLLRLCCFHGHDAPEGSEARAQCAERLTIVGGVREVLLVWLRGPRALEEIVRPRRLAGVGARPLNFTVRRARIDLCATPNPLR